MYKHRIDFIRLLNSFETPSTSVYVAPPTLLARFTGFALFRFS